MAECYICAITAQGDDAPAWQRIYADEHWRVAHAFDTSLPGWLVLVSKRHIESLSEMTPEEALAFGPLVRALSAALETVTGATKAYLAFFAESPQHRHVHVHVVPRMPDAEADRVGPGVFAHLGAAPEAAVSEERRDELAAALHAHLR